MRTFATSLYVLFHNVNNRVTFAERYVAVFCEQHVGHWHAPRSDIILIKPQVATVVVDVSEAGYIVREV
jgi:hypothetical protein